MKKALSQSPPAGYRLPFPPSHLLWMANGTQSSIADLFLTPPTAAAAAVPAAANATPAAPAAKDAGADAPTATAAAAAAAQSTPAVPAPRPRVVLVVGFVGAFLSLCQQQLPPYSSRWAEFRRRGVDSILAVSVNDHAVLKSFAQQAELDLSRVGLIADHDGSFCRGLNLALDLSAAGMGLRARRFAMIVREGVVEECFVEDNPGELTVSSAESMLQQMPIIPELDPATKGKSGAAAGAANAAGAGSATAGAEGVVNGSSNSGPSAAAKVVAAVQRTVAAVSDRFDGTTDAKEAAAAAAVAAQTIGNTEAQQPSTAAPAKPMTEQEREEAAQAAAAAIPPPGQA